MKVKKLSKLLLYIIICEAAGLVGSIFTFSAIPTWYATLNKPQLAPPNSIFGPVWVTLYILMGTSAYLVWSTAKKNSKDALQLFWVQLFFNATWSIMFFGFKKPLLGLLNIVILWLLITIVLVRFWKISQTASLLLIPYFIWVSFATFLNYQIWWLNR